MRLSRRLRVVYSWGLNAEAISAANSKSKNGSKFWCFLGRRPLKSEFEGSKPWKGSFKKHNTSFELLYVQIGPELRPVGEMRKRKKEGEQKSQNRDSSPLCGGAAWEPISTKFDLFVGPTNVITYTKNDYKILIGFSRPTGGKTHVSLTKPTAYITLPCATALARDSTAFIWLGFQRLLLFGVVLRGCYLAKNGLT